MHSGIPGEIIDKLVDTVVSTFDGIEVIDGKLEEAEEVEIEKTDEEVVEKNNRDSNYQDLWDFIDEDNLFSQDILKLTVKETLISGDGAFRISMDTDLSEYPIIEFFDVDNVEYTYERGRLKEVRFISYESQKEKKLLSKERKRTYKLVEIYRYGSIDYEVYDEEGKEVSISEVEAWKDLQSAIFDKSVILAVPMKFLESSKYKDRGQCIYERKIDSFDVLDEVISQWIDAIRAGRVKNYIPEDLLPKDPNTGKVLTANPFDNQFIKKESSMNENANNQIDQVQGAINYEAFLSSYVSMLDQSLQGIISPATLGIDLKKTDNAEAQREKEKTTLYTRSNIIDVLTRVIPKVVNSAIQVYLFMNKKSELIDLDVNINFGEYASPDFESKVQTVGIARSYGIMSLEYAIDELYGDSLSEEEKTKEIERIRNEQSSMEFNEKDLIDFNYKKNEEDNENIEDEEEQEE